MAYWLMKTEPGTFSVEDLEREGKTIWEGVRNYQARNFLRSMKMGERVLIYHSNTKNPKVVGEAFVSKEAFPDSVAEDSKSPYFDPKHTKEHPRWYAVEVSFVHIFSRPVSLQTLKTDTFFKGMEVTRKGSRLSVTPLSQTHFEEIVRLGDLDAENIL